MWPSGAMVLSWCMWAGNRKERRGLCGAVTGAQDQEARARAQEPPGVRWDLALCLPPLDAQSCPDAAVQTGAAWARLRLGELVPFLQPRNRRELNFRLCDLQEE